VFDKSSIEDHRGALASGPWFAGLDASVQDRILAEGGIQRLRKNEVLVNRGDPAFALFGVLDGQLRSQATTCQGRTALISIVHRGDFFSFLTCADGKPHTMDVVASTDSSVFLLPIHVVREIFHADPQLFVYLVEPQLSNTRRFIDYMVNSVRRQPLQRLAERLLELSRSPYYPVGPHHPILGLSQEILASTILCTRQTTNELLGLLQSRNLVKCEYGRIEILDPEGLSALLIGAE
jgi:CRP-like cAMP-binding protein